MLFSSLVAFHAAGKLTIGKQRLAFLLRAINVEKALYCNFGNVHDIVPLFLKHSTCFMTHHQFARLYRSARRKIR